MKSAENTFQRGRLSASDPADIQLLKALSEDQVHCLSLLSERVELEGRDAYNYSIRYENLSPLFVAQSQTLACVAFQIWNTKISLPGAKFESSKTPQILHQIIATSQQVRDLALRALFRGNLSLRGNQERANLTREWLTRYPDCPDLAFEAMAEFGLEGKMLEFLTSDLYRTSKYRIRAAEAVLSWSVGWRSVYRGGWGNTVASETKKRLELLVLIRDTIPNLRQDADRAIRLLLRTGCEYCTSEGKSESINDFMAMYREIAEQYPEYESCIWELVTRPGSDRKTKISFTLGEKYEGFLWEVWQKFPDRRETICQMALLPPDRSQTHAWHTVSQKVLFEKIWDASPEQRDSIFDFCIQWAAQDDAFRGFLVFVWENDPSRRDAILTMYQSHASEEDCFFEFLKTVWDKHPEYRERVYPTLESCFRTKELLYEYVLRYDNAPEEIFRTAYRNLLAHVSDPENQSGWCARFRDFMMKRFPEERSRLWETIKARNPDRATTVKIMKEFPDLATDCVVYLEAINEAEMQKAKQNERLSFAKQGTCYDFSSEWKPDYGEMGDLLTSENAALYPCDRIVEILFASAGSADIEPRMEHQARQVILCTVLYSSQVSFGLRKKAWDLVSNEFERYGQVTRNWGLIWQVAESDSFFLLMLRFYSITLEVMLGNLRIF